MANAADVVLQIVPRVSDNPDGVTDYALNLARNLSSEYRLTTVFAAAERSRISEKEGFKITPMGEGGAPRERPARVILHYVNYGYQKRGLPFSSLPVWRALRQSCRGRFLVIFHELFASGPPWKSEFWVHPLQKKIARDVARYSLRILSRGFAQNRFANSFDVRLRLAGLLHRRKHDPGSLIKIELVCECVRARSGVRNAAGILCNFPQPRFASRTLHHSAR